MGKVRGHGSSHQITSTLLRVYIFLGSGFLILALFFYTNYMIGRLEKEADLLSRIFADYCANTIVHASRNVLISNAFSDMVEEIPFPVIVTDHRGVPWTWHGIPEKIDGISVRIEDFTYEDFMQTDPLNPPPGPIAEVLALAKKMDQTNPPVPIHEPIIGTQVGLVHFGEPMVVRQLRTLPYIQAVLIGIFVLLGYLGYRGLKEGEQRSIWIGMAKETAHQLGTPISSLMGWLQLLRDRASETSGERVSILRDDLDPLVEEMEEDVRRLNKIAYRFSNIGSTPVLEAQDLNPIVDEAIQYLRKRFDRVDKDITVEESFDDIRPVKVNRELIQWVIENLFSNSVDAFMGTDGGAISVSTEKCDEGRAVKITFRDEGCGMPLSDQKKAFYPGFSTKRRGWGLGLPLSQRIVEDYHGGRITIEKSSRNKGTTISIVLPA